MQKYILYLFIFSLVTGIAACGGGSTAPAVNYSKLPTLRSYGSYSSSKPYLMGGAMQGTPLSLSNVISSPPLAGTPGTAWHDIIGVGTAAQYNQPNGITTDGTNFYVADYGNNAIRIIDSSGTVTTLQGFSHPAGITTDGSYLYVADSGSNTVKVINIATLAVTTIGSGGVGYLDSTDKNAVLFNLPVGITTDGKNVFVTDFNNATVRWIDTSDGSNNNYAVYTLAGTAETPGSNDGPQGGARFNKPGHITTNGVNLYVTDFYNRTIRVIAISTGQVSTLAGSPGPQETIDGTGSSARFSSPLGITTDGTTLYVADPVLNQIRTVGIASGVVSTIPVTFIGPVGITTDGTSLLVTETFNSSTDSDHNIIYQYGNTITRLQ